MCPRPVTTNLSTHIILIACPSLRSNYVRGFMTEHSESSNKLSYSKGSHSSKLTHSSVVHLIIIDKTDKIIITMPSNQLGPLNHWAYSHLCLLLVPHHHLLLLLVCTLSCCVRVWSCLVTTCAAEI